ncbi:MAG: alpha/beta hydrolase [Syntrophales bacterium]|jgi:pimeloyl-ACP methyl ester carboxylesterase
MILYQEIKGIRIAYWTRPFKEGRRSLVFIHGSGGDHTTWIHQYSQMKTEFNIVAVDLPGHGRSGGKGEKDIGAYTDWVCLLLEAIPVKKPVLIGHSLGAAICLTFAIRYGSTISGIVSVGGGAAMPVNSLMFEGLKQNPSMVIAMAAKFSLAKSHREQYTKLLEEKLSSVKPELLHKDFFACNKHDVTKQLSKIQVSALIVCGKEDKMAPPALSEFLRDHIKGARAVFLDDAGHFAMMENIGDFNTVLMEFLSPLR